MLWNETGYLESSRKLAERMLKEGGAESVKLEGGVSMAPTVARLVDAGIPVMGHIGLTPQSIHQFGSYKARGQDDAERKKILEDARALEQAGAFAIVVEKVPAALGKEITDATSLQGSDPFVSLGKVLLMPSSVSPEDRDVSLKDLTADEMPADVAAYASFYRSRPLKEQKKNAEALQALLAVPCLYSSGGLILNAASEILAADMLAGLKRTDEATRLINSALRVAKGTILTDEANKRLESLK